MRIRALLLIPALAAAALGIGASAASAGPTLFTTAAHTTRVTPGVTADVTSVTRISLTSGVTTINTCTHSKLHLVLDANNDTAGIQWTVVDSSFSPCNSPVTGNHGIRWLFKQLVNGIVSAGRRIYNAVVDFVSFNLLGGTYTGNLTTGLTVTQTTSASTPLCLHMDAAGSVSGPLTGDGRINGTYCFTGSAAAFSQTNG